MRAGASPHHVRLVILASTCAAALAGPQAALADEAAVDAATIIVTGEEQSYKAEAAAAALKLPLSLKETPQSLTVITRQRIEDFNLNTITDVLNQTPGVVARSLDSNRIGFHARGFSVQNFQLDGVPTVFQTGPSANSALSDMAIYERIEVVRGAAGLVTGIGDPSATVNLVRKRPGDKLAAYANLTAGSWDYIRVEGDVGGPIAADGRIRARVVGAYTDTEQQVRFQRDKSPVVYGTIEADVTPTTLLRAGVDYLKTESIGGAWSAVPLYFTDGTRTDFPRSFSAAARWNNWTREATTAFGAVEQRLGEDWVVKATYTYRETDQESLLFAGGNGYPNRDGSGLGVWDFYGVTDQTENSVDVYASGAFALFGRTHELVVGGTWHDRDFTNNRAGILSRDYALVIPDIFTWNGDVPAPVYEDTGEPLSIEHTRELGAYGALRLNPADGVKVIAGGRYTDWKTATDTYDTNGQVVGERAWRKENRFNPYLGVVVDVTPDVSLFASYTEVFKPVSNRDKDNRLLDPTVGSNYEAGAKAEFFDKRFYVAVSGFHMAQDNVAVLDPSVPPNSLPGGASAYMSLSGAKTWGGEFEVAGEPVPGWSLSGGYTYARTEQADGTRGSFAINPLHIARVHTTYRLPGDLARLTIGGGLSYQSEISQVATIPTGAFNPDGTPVTTRAPVRQGGYVLADLMARYRITDNVSAGLNVSNLFDKRYFNNVGFYNAGFYGMGRRILGNIRVAL